MIRDEILRGEVARLAVSIFAANAPRGAPGPEAAAEADRAWRLALVFWTTQDWEAEIDRLAAVLESQIAMPTGLGLPDHPDPDDLP